MCFPSLLSWKDVSGIVARGGPRDTGVEMVQVKAGVMRVAGCRSSYDKWYTVCR
jgi:hypothetical protein